MKKLLIISYLSFFLLISCGKDNPTEPKKENYIKANPTSLDLSQIHKQGMIILTNKGTSEISWTIKSKPNWIDLSKMEGKITSSADTLLVTANTSLNPGNYSGKISIESNSGNVDISVQLEIKMLSVTTFPKWNLIEGKYNNNLIENFTGYRIFGDGDASGGWDGRSTCHAKYGNDMGTVYGAYKIEGNILRYTYSMSNMMWTNDVDAFTNFGGDALGFSDVKFIFINDTLKIESLNGNVILKYLPSE